MLDKNKPFIVLIIFIALLLNALTILIIVVRESPPRQRHIEVDGKDCIVVFHKDGITSTGASYGHDMAVCPEKK